MGGPEGRGESWVTVTVEDAAERPPRWRHLVLAMLLLSSLAALLVGLVRAQTTAKVPRQATLVLLIDVSASMTADDVQPTRIAAAQSAARTLVSGLPDELRIGLITFSTDVTVPVAPSYDRKQVLDAIDDLSAVGGTAMGDALVSGLDLIRPRALAAARQAGPSAAGSPINLEPAERVPASLLLLSDGADTVSEVHPLTAAGLAAQLEVPVYAVALGTDAGKALIPDGRGGNRLQEVPPDKATLQWVAELTNGRFYRAASASQLAKVYEDIGAKVGHDDKRREASYLPLGIGVVLLVVTAGLGLAWRRKLS